MKKKKEAVEKEEREKRERERKDRRDEDGNREDNDAEPGSPSRKTRGDSTSKREKRRSRSRYLISIYFFS